MRDKQSLFESCEAVSAVVGFMLAFSLAIVAISAMLVYSVPVIFDMQDYAQVQRVEQGFTILDSRISKVALGESPLQTTSVSLMGGTVDVNSDDSDESKITIIITNNSMVIDEFNCSLGTIEYKNNDRTVAYEGGGVWSDYGSEGGTVMISPPEFHYNGVTLTLPIIDLNGQSSSSGDGDIDITVTSDNEPTILYPIPNSPRENPVTYEQIDVYIKSQYYKAWADYADSLTYASATGIDSNKTAIIHFCTEPPQGTFDMPYEFRVGMVNASEEKPIYDLHFYLEAAGSNHQFSPADQEIVATAGSRTLSYIFKKENGIHVWVTYVDTEVGYAEKWYCVNPIPILEKEIEVVELDKDGNVKKVKTVDKQYANLNLTDDSFYMKYKDDQGTYYDEYDSVSPDFSWNLTGPTTELPNYEIEYNSNNTLTINDLTQHYIKLMTKDGSIKFRTNVNPKDGTMQDTVDYDTSKLILNYDPLGNYITYLHVTENELDVTID
ncbi:hypothetical protein LI82_09685 [Methanococcoides methylutens]|uniref:DUF7308 domain-containing protein n=1 Tax=Methanococcoides methylutens TaxID=2226 RepID=A0A099SZ94_METMT|nr:hypothetical protein [Methanococcoides methylutens]KGK98009.1 hypothetical protein LI82_09685 [Methanococcoides methylutens]